MDFIALELILVGLGLIVLGIVYLRKPNLFRRWFWMRTSIAIRMLSPEAYVKYMHGLGWLWIAIGIAAIIIGIFRL